MAQGFQKLENRHVRAHRTLRGRIPLDVQFRPKIGPVEGFDMISGSIYKYSFHRLLANVFRYSQFLSQLFLCSISFDQLERSVLLSFTLGFSQLHCPLPFPLWNSPIDTYKLKPPASESFISSIHRPSSPPLSPSSQFLECVFLCLYSRSFSSPRY